MRLWNVSLALLLSVGCAGASVHDAWTETADRPARIAKAPPAPAPADAAAPAAVPAAAPPSPAAEEPGKNRTLIATWEYIPAN